MIYEEIIHYYCRNSCMLSCSQSTELCTCWHGNYGKILYNWDGTFLRNGESKYSNPLLNFDGQKIRMGESKYATAKWFWDGTVLHTGENKYGRGIVWTDGINIRSGENKYGELLFYKEGTRIKARGKSGKTVFTIQGSIPLPILIWISVLG